jgi:transposase-like protein
MRVDGCVEKETLKLSLGATLDGSKTVLSLQSGDNEPAANWKEVLRILIAVY